MDINILHIIIAVTAIVSYQALNNNDMLYRFLYIPYRVQHNGEKYRLFSGMLIHGDFFHLLFNMMSLYFLGSAMLSKVGGEYITSDGEIILLNNGWMQEYGAINGQIMFLLLYVLGGVLSCIIPFNRHKDNPNYSSLGASGAVSAVIFASIIWNPTLKLYLFFIPIGIPAYIFGPLYIAYEIYMDKRGNTKVAHDAHIGGAIVGILFVLITNLEAGKRFIEQIF